MSDRIRFCLALHVRRHGRELLVNAFQPVFVKLINTGTLHLHVCLTHCTTDWGSMTLIQIKTN